jgi:hypothetical protein
MLLLLPLLARGSSSLGQLTVAMAQNGSLTVSVGTSEWFTSDGAWLMSRGHVYSSTDGSLLLRSVGPIAGSDRIGAFHGSVAKWQTADGGTPLETSVRVYDNSTHAIFAQHFPDGVANASLGQGDQQSLCRDGFEGWCARDGEHGRPAPPSPAPAQLTKTPRALN